MTLLSEGKPQSRLKAPFKSSSPIASDILYSRRDGVSGREEPYYRVTFIKNAQSSGERATGAIRGFGKVFSKTEKLVPLPMPRVVTYSVKDFPTFFDMVKGVHSIRNKHDVTTILGSPNSTALELHDSGSPKLSRTKSYFDFEPARDAPTSALTSYLLIDLDANISQPSSVVFSKALQEQTLTEEHIHLEARRCVSRLLAPSDLEKEPEINPESKKGTPRIDYAAGYDETKYARYTGPMYVRLSSSFGAGNHTKLKAHVYVPLTDMVPIDQIALFMYPYRAWLDSSMYRNPTQPVFTCSPIVDNADRHNLDPLSPTQHNLERQYYFDKLPNPNPEKQPLLFKFNPYKRDKYKPVGFPAKAIRKYLSGNADDLKKVTQDLKFHRTNADRRHLTSTNLPGKIGAFNRSVTNLPQRSVESRLQAMGYSEVTDDPYPNQEGGSRWVSPDSTSGSPGCVVYPSGFVRDFHDTSPIQKMFDSLEVDNYPLSPYHLYRLFALVRGEEYLKKFNSAVDKAYLQDTLSQRATYKGLSGYLSHLYEGMNRSEVDEVWQQILQDAFHQGIANYAKMRLYKDIVKNVREKTQMRVTLEELKMYWSDLRRHMASEMGDIVAANPEALNARLLLDESYVYKAPKRPYFFAESVSGAQLEMLTTMDNVESRITGLLLERSLDPDSWTYAKMKSNVQATIRILTSEADHNPAYRSPCISQSVYAFSTLKGQINATYDEFLPPKTTAVDFLTDKTVPVSIDRFILHTLPFTEHQFKKFERKALKYGGETGDHIKKYIPNWHRFMSTSFKNEPDRVETIRDIFTYCLSGSLSNQYLIALYGEPGSGKSTIKNLLSELFGPQYVLETDPARLGDDDFALANLNEYTRLLVVNEFNTHMFYGNSSRRNRVVNFLKQISGRDEVVVRQMRKDPQTIKSYALPLLISNTIPSINDAAFQSRLRSVHFDTGFDRTDGKQSQQFQNSLMKELPGIFYWAMTNPRKEGVNKGGFQFKETESLIKDTAVARIQANPLPTFLKEYVEATPKPQKGIARAELLYWIDLYLQKHLDLDIHDFLENRKLKNDTAWVNKQNVSQTFPKMLTNRFRLTREQYVTIRDRCPNPETGKKDWACGMNTDSKQTFYTFIKWKDHESMARELDDWFRPDLKTAPAMAAIKKKKAFKGSL